MTIKSDADTICGQPRIEGRRISVAHVVANVSEMGVREYCTGFAIPEKDVKEAIEYCMEERCLGRTINFCQGCRNSGEGEECWKIARAIYDRSFKNRA